MRASSSIVIFLVAVGPLLVSGCGPASRPPTLPPLRSAETFTETDVLPHIEGAITPRRNYVYCPTFQMAWDELCDGVIKEPLQLAGDPPMAAILNRTELPELGLERGSYFAKAGLVKDGALKDIRRTIERRFPNSKITLPEANDDAIVTFAYLEKSLPFAEKFDRLREPIDFQSDQGTTRVAGFGFRGDLPLGHTRSMNLCHQIRVIYYANPHDLVIELSPTPPNDKIVLAKLPRPATLAAALESLDDRYAKEINDWRSQVSAEESVAVPIISLGVTRRYNEIEGRSLLNAPWNRGNYEFTLAEQCVQFRLDENGAALTSQSTGVAASPAAPEIREFIFDKPFLLCLKRKDAAAPYLAIWIETPELLEKQ